MTDLLGRAAALLAPFAAMGGDWAMPAFHDLEANVVVWGPSAGRVVTAGDVRAARRYLDGAPADEPDYRPALEGTFVTVESLAGAAQNHETSGIHGSLHCSLACGASLFAALEEEV